MKTMPKYPSPYQVKTRVWLTELSQELGRKPTLDDIPVWGYHEFEITFQKKSNTN
jgi:hypothetical protein